MTTRALTTDKLRAWVSKLPRLELAHLPTPLEEIPRFADRIGAGRLFIKRDDCTGILMGGNKTRHNEFLLAEALRQGADLVLWGAGVQSNNCRQTAAACARLGLECRLLLSRAAHDDDIQGNLLLDHLVGAKIEIVDEPLGPGLDTLLTKKAEEYRRAGRKVFAWDRDKGRPLAAISYLICLAEIVDQMRERNLEPTAIYCSAAGATGAGLALGRAVLGLPAALRLVLPIQWPWDVREDLAKVANQAADLLDLPSSCRVKPSDIDASEAYIGSGYGKVSPAGKEALEMLARSEGILLDPVYTSKAMAALIADVRNGRLKPGDVTVFIHTGGTPALFAYRDELIKSK